MPSHRHSALISAAVISAAGFASHALARGDAPPVPALLVPDPGRNIAAPSDSRILRRRAVRVDPAIIDLVSSSPQAHFSIPLPAEAIHGGTIEAVVDDLQTRSTERFTCTGSLPKEPGGWFVLSRVDDAVVLYLFSPGRGTFEAHATDDGAAVLDELDQSTFGDCGCGLEQLIFTPPPENEGGIASQPGPDVCAQSIDVLILYTPLAAYAAGGTAAMQALAYACVAVTNLAWQASGIDGRMRLVHAQEIKYDESVPPAGDLGTDLFRLWDPGDGFMDSAAAIRDQFAADAVCLLVQSYSNLCGISYVMTNPNPGFAPFAFSVVQQSCAIGNLSFPHELGHNLGCQHNAGDGTMGAYPWSFGLAFTGGSGQLWRTIMAIGPGMRIAHFSNPSILFDGVPTGIPAGQLAAADNASTINATSSIIGAFRAAPFSDCNGNGTDDACDIAWGISADGNANGVPDECDPPVGPQPAMITLAAGDADSFDRFGNCLALGNDRMVIGSELDDDAGNGSGAAYVFRREDDRWVQEAKLTASDASGFKRFGRSVAITANGDWIVIGAYRDGQLISDVGAAYVFHRSGRAWIQDAKIANPAPSQADWFGWSVALQDAANAAPDIVIGAPADDGVVPDAGAAYIYQRRGGAWTLAATLIDPAGQANDFFGYAIAADPAAGRVAISAPFADRGDWETGAVDVFRHRGSRWSLEQTLLAGDRQAFDRLGTAIAISGDRVLAGAVGDDDHGDRAGAAYVFQHSNSGWLQCIKLFAIDAAQQDFFGIAVALRGDRALVGATLARSGGSPTGAVVRFDLIAGEWTPIQCIAPPDAAANDNFGASVALSPDSTIGAAGAILDDLGDHPDAGTVRIFRLQSQTADRTP